jgi:hypothetical protein
MNCTLNGFLAWSLLGVLCVGFAPPQSSIKSASLKVVVERVERVGHDEVHLSLKVANGPDRPVFLTGINFERPIPDPLFLEQWQTKEGWKTVAPCMDTAPPHVIKLDRSGVINLDLVLKIPLSRICKERNIQLEGKFQYRLYYFDSEKKAQTYLKNLRSGGDYKPEHAVAVVSEPFEIPPSSKSAASER